MDHQIFFAINGLAGKIHFLDSFGIAMAQILIFVFIGLVVGVWWFKDRSLKRNLWIAFLSALVSRVFIVEVIKRIVDRPRPFEVILSVHKLLVDEGSGKSFPSGHAVIFFSIAFAFWSTKWFWPLFTLAVIGSVARIFVGVHYPSDVLIGALIGAGTSLLLLSLFKKRILS